LVSNREVWMNWIRKCHKLFTSSKWQVKVKVHLHGAEYAASAALYRSALSTEPAFQGMEGWVGLVGWPIAGSLPTSCYLSQLCWCFSDISGSRRSMRSGPTNILFLETLSTCCTTRWNSWGQKLICRPAGMRLRRRPMLLIKSLLANWVCCFVLCFFTCSVVWLDRVMIERSRVRVSPTALLSTALDKPLTHTFLCSPEGRWCFETMGR